jgi:alpha-glucuronidase
MDLPRTKVSLNLSWRKGDWSASLSSTYNSETATGSNALAQYAPEVARVWGDPATCPENLLLWFHRLPWDQPLRSGGTLWDGICRHYQAGVDTVRRWQREWENLRGTIDEERHAHVRSLLVIQERDARWWRDACLLYFQTFSGKPLPAGVEPPEHDLAHYRAIKLRWMPGNPSGK